MKTKYLLIVKAMGWPDTKVRTHVRTKLHLPGDWPVEVSWSTPATARCVVAAQTTDTINAIYRWYHEDGVMYPEPYPVGSLLFFNEAKETP